MTLINIKIKKLILKIIIKSYYLYLIMFLRLGFVTFEEVDDDY